MTKRSTVVLGAVGDVSLSRAIGSKMLEDHMDWPFEKMLPHLKKADVLFGNMESVFIPDDFPREQIDQGVMIAGVGGPEGAAALKRAGFDILNMAANHVLDAGSIGLDHTRKCLEEAGILVGGVGWSQEEARQFKIIEKKGIRFGFLCYAEDSNWTLGHTNPGYAMVDADMIMGDVRAHRDEVDVLVVSIHADMEFVPTPSVPRIELSRRIAQAGADIILEHHPHVPQGIEMVDGSLIAYSLGNFIFDAHTSAYQKKNGPHTADAFLLLVQVDKTGVRSFERVPASILEPPDERPCPLEGAERNAMLAYFDELDRLLHDEAFVRKTWRAVARRRVWDLLSRVPGHDVEWLVQYFIGRACLVQENRNCMEEVMAEAREHWEAQKRSIDPYHRPEFRYRKPS